MEHSVFVFGRYRAYFSPIVFTCELLEYMG